MQRQGASLQRKDSTVASKATEAGAWSLAEALPALTADEQSENRVRDPTAGRNELINDDLTYSTAVGWRYGSTNGWTVWVVARRLRTVRCGTIHTSRHLYSLFRLIAAIANAN